MLNTMILLAAVSVSGAIPISDFPGNQLSEEWKNTRCAVTLAPGQAPDGTAALRVGCDFTGDTTYAWVRRILPQPLDVSGTKALSFRVCGDGSGIAVTPHLLLLEPEKNGGTREVAFPGPALRVDFQGWRQYYVPLEAFDGLGEPERRRLRVVNFSLVRSAPQKAEILLADIRFTPAPEGISLVGPRPEPVADERAFYALLDTPDGPLRPVARLAREGKLEEARAQFLAHFENRERPRFFVDWRTRDAFVGTLRANYPGSIEGHIRQADRVLARDFLFEGDHRQLTQKVEWLQGPVEWTHILSRFSYWRSLAIAWTATGDEKYARGFVELLRDWTASNPLPRRVSNSLGARGNTWRTLETGIRCDEWLRALTWFWDAPCFTPADKLQMLRSLVEHARYLAVHEGRIGYQNGNWQVVECAGLAMTALMLPELSEAPAWREMALRLLTEHLEQDVYPDGAHSELTPGYHNWVAERLASVWRLAERNGVAVPPLFAEKLPRMYEYNLKALMPDGCMPALGDAGRGGARGDLALGALLFKRSDFRSQGAPLPPDTALWLFGPEAITAYRALPAQPPAFTSIRMPNAGYLVQRTGWGKDDLYLLLNAVPNGGGHSHPDSLSLDIFGYGALLLTDSGRENYNHPLQGSYFRRTRAHNVVQIDGLEQPNTVRPEVVAWQTGEQFEHAGAQITYAGFEQRRDVVFLKPQGWLVFDRVQGEGRHHLEQWFHFPPGPAGIDAATLAARPTGAKGAFLEILPLRQEGLTGAIAEGWLGFRAGGSEKASVAAYTRATALPAVLGALLVPRRAGAAQPATIEKAAVTVSGKPVPDTQAVAVRVRLGDARFLVGLAYAPGEYACAGHSWREGLLVIRDE